MLSIDCWYFKGNSLSILMVPIFFSINRWSIKSIFKKSIFTITLWTFSAIRGSFYIRQLQSSIFLFSKIVYHWKCECCPPPWKLFNLSDFINFTLISRSSGQVLMKSKVCLRIISPDLIPSKISKRAIWVFTMPLFNEKLFQKNIPPLWLRDTDNIFHWDDWFFVD